MESGYGKYVDSLVVVSWINIHYSSEDAQFGAFSPSPQNLSLRNFR